jgi:hypothetical protein
MFLDYLDICQNRVVSPLKNTIPKRRKKRNCKAINKERTILTSKYAFPNSENLK